MRLLLFIVMCSGIFIGCNTEHQDSRPNIILILADDLGQPQLGCYGSTYYQTPNIDKMSSEGMRFTNAYAAAAVCSPTRASLYTGKYPARLHITDFIAGNQNDTSPLSQPDWQKYLPLEEVTIAEILKEYGYNTALFGKWHLSPSKTPPESSPYNPDKQGFEEFFITYKPSGNLPIGEWQVPDNDAHNVDTITRRSIDFIQKNAGNPFFLVVSHNSIHDPLKERGAAISRYSQKEGSAMEENNPIIAAMVERLDSSVGEIIGCVNKNGIEDNTIIIFYSDNGAKHAYFDQTPYRAGKGWLYEGGIRVPLIAQWNGKILPGLVSDQMISSIDFFPTFLDICITSPDEKMVVEGISFYPVLTGQQRLERKELYWHYPHYHQGSGMKPASAIRSGDYKLIEWYEPKFLGEDDAYELYDLANDIGEQNNLADSLPEKVVELRNMLDIWKSDVNAQEPTLNPNYTRQ